MKSQPIFSQLQKGTTLANGKYVIENKIGEGGFSITYRAVQTGLNRAVCIKEYFLAGRCVRDVQTKTIHVQGTNEELFEKYRVAFVKEAHYGEKGEIQRREVSSLDFCVNVVVDGADCVRSAMRFSRRQ